MENVIITELLLSLTLFLMGVAILIDLRWNRIPNALCLFFLLIGFSIQIIHNGLSGIFLAGAGAISGFLLFLPFYLLKGMAAGDVKMLASLGALLGPANTLYATGYTLIIGAALALLILLFKAFRCGGIKQTAQIILNYYRSLQLFIAAKTLVKPDHITSALQNMRFPYSTAIASGSLIAMAELPIFSFIQIKALLIYQLSSNGGVL